MLRLQSTNRAPPHCHECPPHRSPTAPQSSRQVQQRHLHVVPLRAGIPLHHAHQMRSQGPDPVCSRRRLRTPRPHKATQLVTPQRAAPQPHLLGPLWRPEVAAHPAQTPNRRLECVSRPRGRERVAAVPRPRRGGRGESSPPLVSPFARDERGGAEGGQPAPSARRGGNTVSRREYGGCEYKKCHGLRACTRSPRPTSARGPHLRAAPPRAAAGAACAARPPTQREGPPRA